MHLCAIALYRFVGIVYPLRMRSAQEARHVAALVVPAWSIAIALSVPFVVQGTTHSGKFYPFCYETFLINASVRPSICPSVYPFVCPVRAPISKKQWA